jgi:hypothetical protein
MADRTTPTPDQPQPAPTDRRALTSAANGRRSRGPVTPEGKATSCFNAIKHGIHARRLLITRGPSTEDASELAALYAQFHAEFAPIGIAEELLLERLFVTYWRMRRILHGETALFHDEGTDELAAMVKRVLKRANSRAHAGPDAPSSRLTPSPGHESAAPTPPTFNPAIIDRVTRYEGPLEKAFYRALRELLDLQSRRRARAARRQPATDPD